jgi:phage/plasmid-associated DNA primase
MNHALGEYAGTVPITLVSDKRPGVGGTSSEVIQLKGLRYAVMQEPSKDTRINEGVMKELTGGDKIQARALYSASETFTPQFKLCVCTNTLFEINSNDDGTWRRIRICDFMSKFVDTLDENEPYHFLKDLELDNKIIAWAPLFMSMLVKRAFETNGHVEDCDIVKGSSNRYRQGQDHIAAFVSEMIIKTEVASDKVCKKELSNEFKMWFQESQGMRKMPKGTELYEYMEKKFGKWKPTGWTGIKIAYPEKTDELIEMVD